MLKGIVLIKVFSQKEDRGERITLGIGKKGCLYDIRRGINRKLL